MVIKIVYAGSNLTFILIDANTLKGKIYLPPKEPERNEILREEQFEVNFCVDIERIFVKKALHVSIYIVHTLEGETVKESECQKLQSRILFQLLLQHNFNQYHPRITVIPMQ